MLPRMQEQEREADVGPLGQLLRGGLLACLALATIAGGLVVFVLVFAEPKYVANHGSALGSLKTLTFAQQLFLEGDKDGDGLADYADLAELSDLLLIDGVLGTGTKQGYRFTCRPRRAPSPGWTATAEPVVPGRTGDLCYAANERGEVWVSDLGPVQVGPDGQVIPRGARLLYKPRR
jgi:hypothetical protein